MRGHSPLHCGLPCVGSIYLEHLPVFGLQVTVRPQPMSGVPPHMRCLVGSRMIRDFLEAGTLRSLVVFGFVAALAVSSFRNLRPGCRAGLGRAVHLGLFDCEVLSCI